MKTMYKKWVYIVLAVILIFTSIPNNVLATNSNTGSQVVEEENDTTSTPTEESVLDTDDNEQESKVVTAEAILEENVAARNNSIFSTNEGLGKNVKDQIKESKIELYNNEDPWQNIEDLQSIPIDSIVNIYFEFLLKTEDHTTFKEGDYFDITIPDEISILTLSGELGEIKDGDGYVIAKVSVVDQKVRIVFTDGINDIDSVQLKITINAIFNREVLEDGGKKELVFEVDGEIIETIEVDFEEVELAIEKESIDSYEEDGVYYQTWLLQINTTKKQINEIEVIDTLPSGTIYHSHRFINGSSSQGWEATTSSDQKTLTLKHADTINEEIFIEVTTKVDNFLELTRPPNAVSKNISYYQLKNQVDVIAKDRDGGMIDQVTDTATVNVTPQFVYKDAKLSISAQNITWTVEVNSGYDSLYNTKITDIIPKDLELDESSIRVTKILADGSTKDLELTTAPNENLAGEDKYLVNVSNNASAGTTTIQIDIGDITDKYIITYVTKIDSKFFEGESVTDFENQAYVNFDDSQGKTYQSHNYYRKVTVANNWIEKSGVQWWPVRGYGEWNVTLNPNRYEIDGEVSIIDELQVMKINNTFNMDYYHIFKDENNSYNGKKWINATIVHENGTTEELDSHLYNYEIRDNGRTLEVVFADGVINGQTVILYLESQLAEECALLRSLRSSFYYDNNVEMYNESSLIGNALGSLIVSGTVGSKTVSKSYDSKTRQLEYEIIVNPNQLENMGSVTVQDVLPEFIQYIEDENNELVIYEYKITHSTSGTNDYVGKTRYTDDTINKNSPTVLSADKYDFKYSPEDRTLTIVFPEEVIAGKCYGIKFVAQVVDEFFAETRPSTTFTNWAHINLSNLPNETFSFGASSTKLSSNPLTKTGTYNSTDGALTWQVTINGTAEHIDLEGIELIDELQDGLLLDVTSIKLYKVVSKNNNREVVFDINECITYDYDTNTFIFTLPKMSDIDYDPSTYEEYFYPGYAYILQFNTDILAAGTYSNKITMKGYFDGESDSTAPNITINEAQFNASATVTRKQKITVKKVDVDGETPLEGAVFELRLGDMNLEVAKSGENGVVNFQTLLDIDKEYSIVEIEAPRGYKLLDESIPIKVKRDAEGKVIPETYTYVVKNEPILTDISLVKVDEENQSLASAEFLVTKFSWKYEDGVPSLVAGETLAPTYVSGPNGEIELDQLPYGLYALQEQKAPSGYEISNTFLMIEITHPEEGDNGESRILYWDVSEDRGKYTYIQRDINDYTEETIKYIKNGLQSYKLTIYKTDGGDDNGESKAPLSEAVFDVYKYDNTTSIKGDLIGSYTTDHSGIIELYLPQGYYYIEETVAPIGYQKIEDPRIIHIDPNNTDMMANMPDTSDYSPEFQLNFINNKIIASPIKFQKVNESGQYLTGARFNLYKLVTDEYGEIAEIPNLDSVLEVFETNDQGFIEITGLTAGIYVIQETIAPDGYVRTLDGYVIELTLEGNQLVPYYYVVEGGKANVNLDNWRETYKNQDFKNQMEADGYYKVVNKQDIIYHTLTIYKRDKDNQNLPLSGAVFEIWQDNVQITEGANSDGQYVTGFGGEISLQLPKGTYTLKEIQAPIGYWLDTDNNEITIVLDSNHNEFVYNEQQKVDITLKKVDNQDGELDGAIFNLYQFTAEEFDSNGFPIYDGAGVTAGLDFQMVDAIESDPEIVLTDLSIGWYALQEVQAPDGYIRSLDMRIIYVFIDDMGDIKYTLYFIEGGLNYWDEYELISDMKIVNMPYDQGVNTVDLSQLTILKTDDENNPLGNVRFYIAKNNGDGTYSYLYEEDSNRRIVLITDDMGIASYESGKITDLEPGIYSIIEASGLSGYVMEPTPIDIELKIGEETSITVVNERILVDVSFKKESRQTKEPLKDAVFNLYKIDANSQEDIDNIIASGNVQSAIHFYKSATTKDDGVINFGGLPVGYYIVQEAVAPEGYERDIEDVISIEITLDGKAIYSKVDRSTYTSEVLDPDYEHVFYNDQVGYKVRILKEDSESYIPLEGVEFELSRIVDDSKLERVYVKGMTEDGTYVTDSRGEINLSLPEGEYILFEIPTSIPYGYIAEKLYTTFEIETSLNETTVQVYNIQTLQSFKFKKISDSGENLEGAIFNLHSLDVLEQNGQLKLLGNEFRRSITSDDNGVLAVNDLEYGWYALQEVIAPTGYYRSLDVLVINITPAGVVYYDVFGGMSNVDNYQLREVEDDETILLRNEYMLGNFYSLDVYKTNHYIDENDNQSVSKLADAWFNIYQIYDDGEVRIINDGNSDGIYITDIFGNFNVNLRPGNYRIEEIKAPLGYHLEEDNSIELSIEETDQNTVIITIDGEIVSYDQKIYLEIENIAEGELTIAKKDSKGRALNGAEFTLLRKEYTSSEGNYVYKEVDVYVMDDIDSITIDNILTGEYLLYETKAPEGYQILTEPIKFEIKNSELEVEIKIVNYAIGEEIPESGSETDSDNNEAIQILYPNSKENKEQQLSTTITGDSTNIMMYIGITIFAILFSLYIVKKKIKNV